MNNKISPKYLMKLISDVETALWDLFPSSKYKNVLFYIEKWHIFEQGYSFNDNWENFTIFFDNNNNIDLVRTLNNIDGDTIIKIAIDLGVNTPDFIPSIPTFRNDIKVEHHSASATFENAFRKIESEPSLAIGLANSALESIIKEILKDERIASKIKSNKTLYDLSSEILKVFQIFPHADMPNEIKAIGSSLLTISQNIERLRSDKTEFHGKTKDEYKIGDSIYTYFIINSVTTIGLFLRSFYRTNFPKIELETSQSIIEDDDLPF